MPAAPGRRRSRWAPAAAVGWLVVAAVAGLAPALGHGALLGSYDLSQTGGLGAVAGVAPHAFDAGDQIKEFIPWTILAWRDVHSGHLPLWNPYNGLGGPLAFNFQSAVFSLPMLVAYLFPLRLAFTVVVVVKIVLAGTGILYLCRAAGLGLAAGAFAGTVFELSGALVGWSGWPMTTVLCMLGWVLGASLLVVRRRARWRDVAVMAVATAFTVYGGHPESIAISFVVLAAFVAVVVAVVAVRLGPGRRRRLLRPMGGLLAGGAGGLGLAAPLLLPGSQVLGGTFAAARASYQTLPHGSVVNLLVSGYYGFPVAHSAYFGPLDYYEAAGYVGFVALALAALGVACRWRRPEVKAAAILAAGLAALVWVQDAGVAMDHLPLLRLVTWTRALIPLDGCIAVLAGFGLQCLLDGRDRVRVARRFGAITAVGCVVVVALVARQLHGSGHDHTIRDTSLIVPAVSAAVCLLVCVVLLSRARARSSAGRWRIGTAGAVAVAAVEVVFLLTAAPQLWSSSPTGLVATPAVRELQQLSGTQRVGFAQCPAPAVQSHLGIAAETNAAYRLPEMEIYDPIVPSWYLATYARLAHQAPATPHGGVFCAPLPTAALARDYGVSLVLQTGRGPAPAGTVKAGSVGGEAVYSVPGGGVVTLQPEAAPADDPGATVVPVSYADPSRLHLKVSAPVTSRLEVHVAAYRGWRATIDGRPLELTSYLGHELQAVVPPGRHTIVVSYQPGSFAFGLVIGGATLLVLAGAGVLGPLRRRRRPRPTGPPASGDRTRGSAGAPADRPVGSHRLGEEAPAPTR